MGGGIILLGIMAVIIPEGYTVDDSAESTGECEGLAVRNGYVLVANTEDPSVCLLKASWVD